MSFTAIQRMTRGTLARPVLGNHPNRRLGYVVAAFVAITPTFPGLEDRTLWAPMAPAILLAIQSRLPRGEDAAEHAQERAEERVDEPADQRG